MIGCLLSERYKIVKTLSSGGMSQTYVAEDTQRPGNPSCVVKQLRLTANAPNALEKTRKLFNTEAGILERLGHHDQIPRLLAYFEQEQDFYLVQELIAGRSLSHEISLGKRWSELQVIQLLHEVLLILKFVHSQNVIHLDIKPANIVRRQSDKKLVLIDFGAVKQIQLPPSVSPVYQELGKTHSSVLVAVGTPGYMPTEQAIGKSCMSSDIYALGMTAIQALTGILPLELQEDDNGEVIWRNQSQVSDELANILTKMVRHFHKQRYQSAAETLQALQQSGLELESSSVFIPEINSDDSLTNDPFYTPSTIDSNLDQSTDQKSLSGATLESLLTSEKPTVIISPNIASKTSGGTTVTPQKNRRLIGGVALLLASLISGGIYLGYREIQRRDYQAQLDEIRNLKEQSESEKCIAQAEVFPETYSALHDKANNLLEECSQQLLGQAKELAKKGSHLAAVAIAKKIPPAAVKAYENAKTFSEDSHKNILRSAVNEYALCEWNTAIAWASGVPEDSTIYKDVTEKITFWKQEKTENQALLTSAEQVMAEEKDWNAAQEDVDKLKLSGESIPENSKCWENPDIKVIINEIENLKDIESAEKEKKAAEERAEEERISREEAQRKNPLTVTSARLAQGLPNVLVLDDDTTLYRDHPVPGYAGDIWRISMRSDEFDTYICLITQRGRVVACNDDDPAGSYNSFMEVTVPEDGTYRVRANALYPPPLGQGNYSLDVTKVD